MVNYCSLPVFLDEILSAEHHFPIGLRIWNWGSAVNFLNLLIHVPFVLEFRFVVVVVASQTSVDIICKQSYGNGIRSTLRDYQVGIAF